MTVLLPLKLAIDGALWCPSVYSFTVIAGLTKLKSSVMVTGASGASVTGIILAIISELPLAGAAHVIATEPSINFTISGVKAPSPSV